MKLNTSDFLCKCQHPLLLALGSIPIAIFLVMNRAPELLARMWFVPLLFVLLAWGCILLPGRKRLAGGIAGAALLMAAGSGILHVQDHLVLLLLPVLYVVLLFVTLPIGGWPRGKELNVAWYVTGTLLYVLLQLLIQGSRLSETYIYEAACTPFFVCFLAFAGLLVLSLNRSSLDSAAMSRRTVPLLMRRQNTVITIAMMALGLLIAAIPAIGSTLNRLWDLLIQGVGMLAALIAALLPQRQQSGGAAAPAEAEQLSLGEVQEASALALLMEKILGGLTLIILLILIFFAGRALIKQLIKLTKYLWARMAHYSAVASEDYEDEITDTRDESDVERQSLFGRLRRMAPADEKGMSPTERVRYRYKRLKQKHADWSSASTARETLAAPAASLYERARYGGETLTEEEAARFREETKRA